MTEVTRLRKRGDDATEAETGPAQEGPPQATARGARRDAIARAESIPGDKVRMTFRLVLARQNAEALAAWAILEEKHLPALVTEILESAAIRGRRP